MLAVNQIVELICSCRRQPLPLVQEFKALYLPRSVCVCEQRLLQITEPIKVRRTKAHEFLDKMTATKCVLVT